jgi:hypothetical protein
MYVPIGKKDGIQLQPAEAADSLAIDYFVNFERQHFKYSGHYRDLSRGCANTATPPKKETAKSAM